MAKYIKREEAVKVVEKYGLTNGFAWGRNTGLAICIANEIADIPAADVAPVAHGHRVDDGGFYARCSQCDGVLPLCANYCPNCGAKMDGGADNA